MDRGTMIVYRKLLPSELADYCAHLLRLDPQDRRARFLAPTDDATIKAHVGELDPSHTIVLGGFINGVMRGAVELVGSKADGMKAVELAVSIERSFQNTGAGTQLVRQAVLIAQNRGIRRIAMLCLRQNKRMQAICKKLNGLLDFDEADVMCDIKVAAPSQCTFVNEMVNDGLAVMGTALSQWGRKAPEPIGERPAVASPLPPPAAAGVPPTAARRAAAGPCGPA
jgi:GNAT superfamily N-acetyltransferase